MEVLQVIDRNFDGYYCLIDCCLSHGQLLFRKTVSQPDGGYHNEDLLFMGVDYIEVDLRFSGMHISNGTEEDWLYIASRYGKRLHRTSPHAMVNLFRIVSEGRSYYILASFLKIGSNELAPLKTSIEFKQ